MPIWASVRDVMAGHCVPRSLQACYGTPAGSVGEMPTDPAGPCVCSWLDRRLVALTGADPDHAVDRRDPDLAVTDPAGLRRLHDDVGDVGDVAVVDHDLDPDLRHQ